ncbi:DHHC palmitoyltransferase-domain-containing protein [Mariannaea sp. PMI_226]|nr:DHHC palmitoyltransferase-domain-containing protein [Mariannaea sp. PMI_226]
MPRPVTSNRAETRWIIRIIPFFLVGVCGFATYVIIPHLSVNYLYRQKHKTGAAITFIVLYFLFFILAFAAYLRTFLTCQFNPGLVPLSAERQAIQKKHKRKPSRRGRDVEAQPWVPPDSNPDSPGLEAFYSRDVFVCELDGRPKWCSDCRAWKPDRAHHSSELDRCIRKMDHLCPWVGGVVSETSFNFFSQFTFYASLFCATCIAASAYSLRLQLDEDRPLDGRIVASLVLASIFALFTISMTLTSVRFITTNITNIDMLRKNQTFRLAVRIHQNTAPTNRYETITYPLSLLPPSEQSSSSTHRLRGAPMGTLGPVSPRDEQAKRTFAILATEPGENPWNVGIWKNCTSVMGHSVLAWLLPIWHSPCCNHDSMESDYEFGPIVEKLKKRYGITEAGNTASDGIEMRST